MPARTELKALAAARPAILDRTEEIVNAAEENRIFRQILLANASRPCLDQAPPRAHWPARRRTGVTAAAAAALVGAAALALASAGNSSPGPRHSQASGPDQTAPRPGAVIRLAGYDFKLPAGFTAVTTPCAPIPNSAGLPMRGSNPFAAAATSRGGCLEAYLAAGRAAAIPVTAQPVQVGPYQGFISAGPGAHITLYVKMPAADNSHRLVLVARGLTRAQVVAIATSGLRRWSGTAQRYRRDRSPG